MSDSYEIAQGTVQELCVPEDGWIRRYTDTYYGHVEVPPEAFAGAAYTLLSSVIGWKAHLQWADASEPLTLYTALIGASATSHKTTSLSIAERVARDANYQYQHLLTASMKKRKNQAVSLRDKYLHAMATAVVIARPVFWILKFFKILRR